MLETCVGLITVVGGSSGYRANIRMPQGCSCVCAIWSGMTSAFSGSGRTGRALKEVRCRTRRQARIDNSFVMSRSASRNPEPVKHLIKPGVRAQ